MTLDQLEALCRGATPGPWRLTMNPNGNPYEILGMFNGNLPDPIVRCEWASATERGHADYAYIAACSPEYILGLIRVARAARMYASSPDELEAALEALNTPETGK